MTYLLRRLICRLRGHRWVCRTGPWTGYCEECERCGEVVQVVQ